MDLFKKKPTVKGEEVLITKNDLIPMVILYSKIKALHFFAKPSSLDSLPFCFLKILEIEAKNSY